ncbi:MAG: translation initiation factor IF-2 [Wenzhouxiangellaceae bacterium]
MSSEMTVGQLAQVLNLSTDKLLSQFKEAGIDIASADAVVSGKDKKALLEHLRSSHGKSDAVAGAAAGKVALRRRSRSELSVSGGTRPGGRPAPAKKINVEVRKKRTLLKSDAQRNAEAEQEREKARQALEEIRQQREAEQQRLQQEAARKSAENEAQAAPAGDADSPPAQVPEKAVDEPAAVPESVVADAGQAEEAAAQSPAIPAQDEADVATDSATEAPVKPARADKAGSDEDSGPAVEIDEEAAKRIRQYEEKKRSQGKPRGKGKRRDEDERKPLHVTPGSGRRRKGKSRRPAGLNLNQEHGFQRPTEPVQRDVAIPEIITVGELAKLLAIKSGELIKVMMKQGMMLTINQPLEQDTAILIVEELGHSAHPAEQSDIEDELAAEASLQEGEGETRPPVVTIMGHVDHGKTSLLDYIRKSKVVDSEAGGITQHIGAYHVESDNGGISFLDTPGHAAFTAMRARGATATDIVVVVVAANDGVMPQTEEAIQHSRAANVPMIIAINKMDLEDADPDRVKNELSKLEVIPEEWGGDQIFVEVSAKSGAGVDNLLDAILLQAEVLELKADPQRKARGVVIESRLDKGRGPVATLLIQDGTLHQGDMVLAGETYGRARSMHNERGERVDAVGPSFPVEILGLSGVPDAGDEMMVVANERKAREAAEQRSSKSREGRLAQQQAAKLKNLFENMGADGQKQTINLVIKADVQGSVEALRDALTRLSNDEIEIKVISSGVGGITESDASLAQASNAIIIGFNVRADATARKIIKDEDLDLHYYSIIYEAIDQVKAAITGLLGTETQEQIIGLAEVKDVFRSAKLGAIAGCLVVEGVVKRDRPIRVLRDNVVVFEGELESLRRFKDDVKQVESGTECGIGVKAYNDVRPGDQIECFERIEVARTLD